MAHTIQHSIQTALGSVNTGTQGAAVPSCCGQSSACCKQGAAALAGGAGDLQQIIQQLKQLAQTDPNGVARALQQNPQFAQALAGVV